MTAKKRVKEGYTIAEMRLLTDKMIDESAERLRKRLREAWRKRAAEERRTRHGIAV